MSLMVFAGIATVTGFILAALTLAEIAARITKDATWTQKIRSLIVYVAYPLFLVSITVVALAIGEWRLLAIPLLFLAIWLSMIIAHHPKLAARFYSDLRKNRKP
ncbi:MAG: hypothetical protein AAB731_03325 [Patescibacteria group bacterium]|mgnify:CR=1 FL=1